MKILIVGSPKTGNVWIERLLAKIYNLPILDLSGTSQVPPLITQTSFIAHQHYPPISELLEWGERENVRFITILRHPGDMFVSYYYYINNFAPVWAKQGPNQIDNYVLGEAIDSPKVLEFLRTKFKHRMRLSTTWLKSGKSLLVRYEDLKQSPLKTLKRLTDQLEPVTIAQIEEALTAAHIDKLRQESELMRLHCRQGKVGSWQEELGEAHISIIHRDYAQELKLLGYNLDGSKFSQSQDIDKDKTGKEQFKTTEAMEAKLRELSNQITTLEDELSMAEIMLILRSQELASTKNVLQTREEELNSVKYVLEAHDKELASIKPVLQAREEELASIKPVLQAREEELASVKSVLEAHDEELASIKPVLQAREEELAIYKNSL